MREAASRFSPSTRQQQRGNIETSLMLFQKGSRLMPKDRGAEQGPILQPGFSDGGVAAQQASSSLPWIGVADPSDFQRLPAEHAVRL